MTEFPEPPGGQEAGSPNAARTESREPSRQGSLCPQCGRGDLDYNGLLELECPVCGYRDTGGAGYT